jgi:UPF0755 protein
MSRDDLKPARTRSRSRNRRPPRLARVRPARWQRPTRIALGAALALVVTVGALAFEYWRFLARRGPGDARVAVNLPPSLDAQDAATLLVDAGLCDSPRWLALHFALARASRCFVPGPHLISRATARELVAQLCRTGARPSTRVTFPEGVHRFAMADRLQAQGVVSREAFLHATVDGQLLRSLGLDRAPSEPSWPAAAESAEGFLFPASYQFHVDSDPRELVRVLVREAKRRFDQAVLAHPEGFAKLTALPLSRRQIITLASMVEKEAAVADERPIIASVFLNRLRDPAFRRLQSDPTAVYGCYAMPERIAACRGFTGQATPELNRDPDNLFSTYVVDGLPPGPIGNPGDLSIAAVLAPAETRYRYFVAKGGGRHTFSETYEQHLAAVHELRERRH